MATRKRPPLYIKPWMDHFGFSDESLAEKLDVARETVWRWHTQQHRLNPDKIALIAGALGISPEDLWRPPSEPSVDALLRNAPTEVRQQAADIISALIKRRGEAA